MPHGLGQLTASHDERAMTERQNDALFEFETSRGRRSFLVNEHITRIALPTLHTPHPCHTLVVPLDLITRAVFE